MKTYVIILFVAAISASGCTSTDIYPITNSLAKINEMQILDPMAPENNAGVVNDLGGKYGEKVISGYQESTADLKDARTSEMASQAMESGGN